MCVYMTEKDMRSRLVSGLYPKNFFIILFYEYRFWCNTVCYVNKKTIATLSK